MVQADFRLKGRAAALGTLQIDDLCEVDIEGDLIYTLQVASTLRRYRLMADSPKLRNSWLFRLQECLRNHSTSQKALLMPFLRLTIPPPDQLLSPRWQAPSSEPEKPPLGSPFCDEGLLQLLEASEAKSEGQDTPAVFEAGKESAGGTIGRRRGHLRAGLMVRRPPEVVPALAPYQLRGETFVWSKEMVDIIHMGESESSRLSFLDELEGPSGGLPVLSTLMLEGTLYLSSLRVLFIPSALTDNEKLAQWPMDSLHEPWLHENYETVSQSAPDKLPNFPKTPCRHPFAQIPIVSLVKMEKLSQKVNGLRVKCLEFVTGFGRSVVLSFRSCATEREEFLLKLAQITPNEVNDVFGALHLRRFASAFPLFPLSSQSIYQPYDLNKAFCSWVNQKVTQVDWRLSTDNLEYELCPSYPGIIIVPFGLSDEVIRKACRNHVGGCLPVVSWIHAKRKCALLRSSISVERNVEDDLLLKACAESNPYSQTLFVFDLRSKQQSLTKKGIARPFVSVRSLALPLPSEIQDSWLKLHFALSEALSPLYLSHLYQSKWLQNLQGLLSAASGIAGLMELKGNSVLLCDATGFTQVPQLSSLILLMLSPHFRTIQGFCHLIEREWLQMGYPFATHCGHSYAKRKEQSELSPLFIQFLDCVWQLVQLYPQRFEFNEAFLVALALAPYEGLFSTFLGDCESQRASFRNPNRLSDSLWIYLFSNLPRYQSPSYQSGGCHLLAPRLGVGHLRVWSTMIT